MLRLAPYSIGIGDRFARQAEAQLSACEKAARHGVDVIPVWNKSNREHLIVSSEPESVRFAADQAVRLLGWTKPYHVDADHIRLETVERFVPHCDFFTVDVAEAIGRPAEPDLVRAFVERHGELSGRIMLPGMDQPLQTTYGEIESIAAKYLLAVREAGEIYRHVLRMKKDREFITEISMDETDSPQTPPELLVILAAIADEGIPLQTIAPKFTGRFNKGVDYVGNLDQFEKEFSADVAVINYAIRQYGLPESLKLSIHSGSDKFSIYPVVRKAMKRFNAGVHLKTAGTTWLEEIIGLAEAGGEGLDLAKEIYLQALEHVHDLCAPYSTVIDIDVTKLPAAGQIRHWNADQYVSALRHDPGCADFNPHLRQLLHVGYKIAAKMGDRYLGLLEQCRESISKNVTHNLFTRHIEPLFLELPSG
jgi:tagaturonate epimerase